MAYQQQFTELLANAPPTLDAVTAVSPELRDALANTAALVQVLAQQKTTLKTLLTQGSTAFDQVDNLLDHPGPQPRLLPAQDTANIVANIDQPTNLTNLSVGLTYNQYFFGAVNTIAVPGLAKATSNGGAANPTQIFLRTRLIIPPELTQGDAYATANPIPDTRPGAGCNTVYGSGAGPASQANFTPAAGGTLVPAAATDANVELPAVKAGAASSTVFRGSAAPSGSSQWMLVGAGGLVIPALALAFGARPSRRRARRRA